MAEKIATLQFDGEKWEGREDAVWYHGINLVSEVTLTTEDGKKFVLEICCDGETLAQVPREDGGVDYVRYADEWEALGVTNDKELYDFSRQWLDKGTDIWIHNSWFDLYAVVDDYREHLDAVCHEFTEAQAQAEAILDEVATHGSWENYLGR